jgi:hypothetical protein
MYFNLHKMLDNLNFICQQIVCWWWQNNEEEEDEEK